MRVLKTRSAADRDREERREYRVEEFREHLSRRRLSYPDALLEDLGVALRRPGLILLSGPSGAGKSALARELASHLTAGYRQPGFVEVAVRPQWRRPEDLLGEQDEERGRYRSTPFLELWLRALRHKAKPHFLVLDGLDRAPPRAYLGEILAAGSDRSSLVLHAEHLRCQPRAGLPDELRNFFVCHQDCGACFFVVDGYPRGVTDAVQDFVPARAQLPPNLFLLGVLDGSPEELPEGLRDRGMLLEVEACGLRALDRVGALPALRALPGGLQDLLELETRLGERGQRLSPRIWVEVDALLGQGVGLRRALAVRLRGMLPGFGAEDLGALLAGFEDRCLPEGARSGDLLEDPEVVRGGHPHEGREQGQSPDQQADQGKDPVVDLEIRPEDAPELLTEALGQGDEGIPLVEEAEAEDHEDETENTVEEDGHSSPG